MLEEKKLDIRNVSLAVVADQFIEFIKNRENIDIKYLASFLSIAAYLLLLKSKVILPSLEISKEETENIEELKEQLEKYKQARELAEQLKKLARNQREMFSRGVNSASFSDLRGFHPPKNLNLKNLKDIFYQSLKNMKKA